MIKNYLLAAMLSCAATGAFAQKDVRITKLSPADKVTVDGVKDSFYGSENAILNCTDLTAQNVCGVLPQATNCNNIASWSAVYDETSLYVFFNVIDAAIVTADMKDLHQNDGVEVVMSMENNRFTKCPNDGATWPRMYKGATFQFIGRAGASPLMGSPQPVASSITAFKSVTTPLGYTYEIQFSWYELDISTLGLSPTVGRRISFDVGNNDADLPNMGRQSQQVWNASGLDRNWSTAENFGYITLGDVVGVNSLTSLVNDVTIVPNPATSEAKLVIDAKQQDEVSISVLNTLSQTVYSSTQVISLGSNNHTIPTADLANGIYTVVISKGNLNTTKKLVVNK